MGAGLLSGQARFWKPPALPRRLRQGSHTREAQALQAYMFLASIRDSERLTAIVSSAEVAAHVLTKDGGSTVSEATYRRYTRNDLKLCGLVDFPCSRGGRDSATVYTFPAFMRLYGIVDNLGATAQEPAKPCTGLPVQNVRDMYGLTRTKHAQKVASIELLEDRYMGMEEGYSISPQETPSPVVENHKSQQQAGRGYGETIDAYCSTCREITRFKGQGFDGAIGQEIFACTRCGEKTFL